MRVERVTYFVEAARSGSMRAAAERLGVTQSVLSMQIKALEEELNVVLLRRSRYGVTMSTDGENLFEQALDLIEAQRALVNAATHLTDDVVGHVRVGANPMLALSVVAPAVSETRKIHMGLRADITEHSSPELVAGISRGTLDFALMTRPPTEPPGTVRRETVATFELSVYAMPGHRLYSQNFVTWVDVEQWPLISMRRGTSLGDRLAARLPDARLAAEVGSLHHVTFMTEIDIGVGIGVPVSSPLSNPLGRWIPIHEPEVISIELVQLDGAPLSRPARLLRDAVRVRARQQTTGKRTIETV